VKTSARFVAATKFAGFSLEYEEAPFEWTVNKAFSVHRRMRSGPLASYTYRVTLEPLDDGGTRAVVRLELVPRMWLVVPIVALEGRRFVGNVERLATEIDAHLVRATPSPFRRPASPANEARLAFASKELESRGLDRVVVERVLELVRSGADADLVRIRPFELAAREGIEPRETLRALLHAVTLGVVELRWGLVCPSCRTASSEVESLSELRDEGHCQLCDLRFGTELDRAVEATFRPHPSVRAIEDTMFCIGGPWRTPHVLVQANLEAHAECALEAPVESGRYRVFARGGSLVSLEVEPDAPAELVLTLDASGLSPPEARIAPGGRVRLTSALSEPTHAKIERLGYASLAATAHVVTTMSEFRKLFSRELLKPSTPLRVGHCTLLFSDLTGSTALYAKAGDAVAFRLVDDHFDVLRKAVDRAGGAVVKTMGDAIMAAFLDPAAGVRAAVACLRAFEGLQSEHPHAADTGLKLGLYTGPCYVVTANDTIDYFGQTVNCAARVQHLAASGEIVLERQTFEALGESERAQLDVVETMDVRVKGVEQPLSLLRTRLAEPAAHP
ncbi:MAG: adenylate/guanylate cyclase domain-containing protein, partial [Deltaproteobacteria bacterium]|nr:adenylate/guanylate cyclase domain-containing protein [Deltaproteobacteria bacterium]